MAYCAIKPFGYDDTVQHVIDEFPSHPEGQSNTHLNVPERIEIAPNVAGISGKKPGRSIRQRTV